MNKFNRKALTILGVLVFMAPCLANANSISISHVQGLDPARGLMTNYTIRFNFRFESTTGTVDGFYNGFRLYSPEGASWQPITVMQSIMLSSYFDLGWQFHKQNTDGLGEDSIAISGIIFFGPGFVPGFDSNVFFVQTIVFEEDIGKTLCVDSSSYIGIQDYIWLWSTSSGDLVPGWGGPYCYDIVDCCVGNRGDVNGDGVGPNIIDLTRLVDYLFRGASAPICKNESDVNGDGTPHNLFDLTYLVDYLHRGGPPSPACPQ